MDYGLAFAYSFAEIASDTSIANLQSIAVLYLRANNNTPDAYKIELRSFDWRTPVLNVPVVKVSNYSLSELFYKKLYFLLPFHIFTYESKFEQMETNADERRAFVEVLNEIIRCVEDLEADGTLESMDAFSISDNLDIVAKALIPERFSNLRKEVFSLMTDRDYRTRSQKIYDKGIAQGEAKGVAKERLASIRSVMKSFKVPAQMAMEALNIPASEWKGYAAQL